MLSLTQDELISQVKNGNFENFSFLVDQVSGLCYDAAKKYVAVSSGRLSPDDLFNKEDVIFRSAQKYDPTLGSFTNLVYKQTRWDCLKNLNHFGLKEIPTEDIPEETYEVKTDEINWVRETVQSLPEGIMKDIVQKRYFNGEKVMAFREIAKLIGVSYQRVQQIHEEFVQFAKNRFYLENMICESR